MRQIILASRSPRRQKLLETVIGKNFKVHVSKYEENNHEKISPEEIARKHALGKARDVASHYDSGVVIGGDVFVVLENEILGKPKDREDAFRMLKKQSGRWTRVLGGLAVIDIDANQEYVEVVETKVKMTKLADEEIWAYINTGDPLDKGGSFGMMDKGMVVVEEIDGCFTNVSGLSLPALHKIFRKIGISIFDY